MNHMYKVVFNKATNTFTAVAEYAKGQGKSSAVGTTAATTTVTAHTSTLNGIKIPLLSALALAMAIVSPDVYVHVNDGTNASTGIQVQLSPVT